LKTRESEVVHIQVDTVSLDGELSVPEGAKGIVLFAHGSGSSRHSPRGRQLARALREAGLGTLEMNLLVHDDPAEEAQFDTSVLTRRLKRATLWLKGKPQAEHLGVAYFGASTGAAVALGAAAELGPLVRSLVLRGARPDAEWRHLDRVQSPTLMIVGERDPVVLELNRHALEELKVEKELAVVPGATHLFREQGALDEVGRLAVRWFKKHF
jgi:pimeloyl-ACP methyl ester carboxylesterase